MSALSTATTIAFLLAALKVGDVALTPEQQRSVQKFSDDLALRLEYANVDHLYRVFRQQRWQRAIYAIPILLQLVQLFATLPLAKSIFQHDLQAIGLSPADGATIVWIAELILVALSMALLVFITKVMWQPCQRVFDWLIAGKALPSRDVAAIILIAGLVLAVKVPADIASNYYEPFAPKTTHSRVGAAELSGPIGIFLPPTQHEERLLRLKSPSQLVLQLWVIEGIIVGTLGAPIAMISLDAGLLACILVAAAIVRCLLWFVRKVMWRIATHSKEAWAAILVLLTGLLAVADVLMKRG